MARKNAKVKIQTITDALANGVHYKTEHELPESMRKSAIKAPKEYD